MMNLKDEFILLDTLMKPPSLEQELEVEKFIAHINTETDIEVLKRHVIALERGKLHQSHFISNCMSEMAKLKAKIACMENPVKQPKPSLFQKIFG